MMRRLGFLIASALLAVGLSACADSSDQPADTAVPGSSAAGGSSAPKGPRWTQVRILDITSAGGTVSDTLAPLSDPGQVDAFVAGLDSPDAARRVRRAAAAAEIPAGHRLMGAVVAQGCEPPTEVVVRAGSGPPTVHAEVTSTNLRCFAAITSVALVSVRADLTPAG